MDSSFKQGENVASPYGGMEFIEFVEFVGTETLGD
jgi:hypothetical protein